jgi:hypothetical protein
VRRSNEGFEKWLKGTENLMVYEGHARFEDVHRVRVGDELLEADEIFINVRGRALTPPLPGHAPRITVQKVRCSVPVRGFFSKRVIARFENPPSSRAAAVCPF